MVSRNMSGIWELLREVMDMKQVLIRLVKAIGLALLMIAGIVLLGYGIERVWFIGPLVVFALAVCTAYIIIEIYELERRK